jgi:hypothetical protein
LSRETEKTVRLVAERHIKAIGHLWQDFLTGTSSIA